MTTAKSNPKVDSFFHEATQWRNEMVELRKIILACGLAEDLKWSKPCYAFQGNNVVIIQPFKACCALLFFKGALLKDPNGILVKTGPNTQVGRQIRFTDARVIVKMASILKAYINHAIEVEKSGQKVVIKKVDIKVPEELQKKLDGNPALRTAFEALTPGRQRGYIFYFSAPKQPKTRDARIEKCIPLIFDGIGLYDEYASKKKSAK
jgi:uncharacterized protein YdeI (YjbR/CyaY-like superfamily)